MRASFYLNGTQIKGEASIALPPLRADARRKPPPDPRRGHAHDLSCTKKEGWKTIAVNLRTKANSATKQRRHARTRRRVVAMVLDGAAGEAAHGEERAGVLFHAERTRSRAAPPASSASPSPCLSLLLRV